MTLSGRPPGRRTSPNTRRANATNTCSCRHGAGRRPRTLTIATDLDHADRAAMTGRICERWRTSATPAGPPAISLAGGLASDGGESKSLQLFA